MVNKILNKRIKSLKENIKRGEKIQKMIDEVTENYNKLKGKITLSIHDLFFFKHYNLEQTKLQLEELESYVEKSGGAK